MRLINFFCITFACTVVCAAQTAAPAAAVAPSAVPDKPGLYAVFDTSLGQIVTELFEAQAPLTVQNFVALATGTKAAANAGGTLVRRHYYDGLTFHRVIKGFMIQTGDVRATGSSNCAIARLKDEIVETLRFDTVGRLAMANTGSPNTGACQVFITVSKPAFLNGSYTIFGQVVAGQEVATAISEVPVASEKPVTSVIVKKITIERKK